MLKAICFSPCSGLVVTSYNKNKYDTDARRKLEKKIYSSSDQYKKFKKMYELQPYFKGEVRETVSNLEQ